MPQWPVASWSLVAIASAVLLTGSFVIRNGPLQRIRRAGLLTAGSSIAVTLIFGDWLHSVLFIQAQAWRWMWLVQFLAILVLPVRDFVLARQ